MTAPAITPCPDCGERSSEDYDANGRCYECFHAAGAGTADEPEATEPRALRFLTPAELRAETPPEPDWLMDGYLAAGVLTIGPAGKPKIAVDISLPDASSPRSMAILGGTATAGVEAVPP